VCRRQGVNWEEDGVGACTFKPTLLDLTRRGGCCQAKVTIKKENNEIC
jgi:hypothetical protein